jgi:hypothetical protein
MQGEHTAFNRSAPGYDWETTYRLVSRIASTDRDVDAIPVIRDLLVSHGKALWYGLRDKGTQQRAAILMAHRAGVDALFDILCRHYPNSEVAALAILDVLLWRRRLASAFEATGLGVSRVDPVRAARVSDFYSYCRQYADWVWSAPYLRGCQTGASANGGERYCRIRSMIALSMTNCGQVLLATSNGTITPESSPILVR